MKMLMRFDLYLWNHFIPRIDADFFERKFNSILAMLYISLFKMPRKFLFNYFRGDGKAVHVDTQELVVRNRKVLQKLKAAVQQSMEEGQERGSIFISQAEVLNPGYKYAVGSFQLNCVTEGEKVEVDLHSNYRFQDSPDRITRNLHHWLYTLKNSGKTNDFEIVGARWITSVRELVSIKSEEKQRQEPNLKLLV